jgi:hypothetical protein
MDRWEAYGWTRRELEAKGIAGRYSMKGHDNEQLYMATALQVSNRVGGQTGCAEWVR